MICKNKHCHNTAAEGERYCKYHLVKKSVTNRKVLVSLITIASTALFISDKFRKKKEHEI